MAQMPPPVQACAASYRVEGPTGQPQRDLLRCRYGARSDGEGAGAVAGCDWVCGGAIKQTEDNVKRDQAEYRSAHPRLAKRPKVGRFSCPESASSVATTTYRPLSRPGPHDYSRWLRSDLRAAVKPDPAVGQIQRLLRRPPAVMPPGADRASVPVSRSASAGTTTPIENALPVPHWQSVQWHVYTLSGACMIA